MNNKMILFVIFCCLFLFIFIGLGAGAVSNSLKQDAKEAQKIHSITQFDCNGNIIGEWISVGNVYTYNYPGVKFTDSNGIEIQLMGTIQIIELSY